MHDSLIVTQWENKPPPSSAFLSMSYTGRLYHCQRCHAQVILCSRCDRGQRYCLGECSQIARTESSRRAGKKYRSSRAGRFNNAQRQQRFRAKNQQKVTHHGSPEKRPHALLPVRLKTLAERQKPPLSSAVSYCHHCGAVCESFLRQDFLHEQRSRHANRRSAHFQSRPTANRSPALVAEAPRWQRCH